jgi:hypothetical protein
LGLANLPRAALPLRILQFFVSNLEGSTYNHPGDETMLEGFTHPIRIGHDCIPPELKRDRIMIKGSMLHAGPIGSGKGAIAAANLAKACAALGWQGGTIHQVMEATGLSEEDIWYSKNIELDVQFALRGKKFKGPQDPGVLSP